MSRIDLKKSSGLPLTYDGDSLISSEIGINEIITITVDDIRPHLLNEELTSPEKFYTKYKNLDQDGIYAKKNLQINLYTIPANLAGIEYVKTKASRVADYPRILEVLYGAGAILMQNFRGDEEGDIIYSSLKKGQKIIVPANYSISIMNTRQYTLCVLEVVVKDSKELLELDEMGGMSYYVIRKNAKQEIVRNPTYKFASSPRRVNWDSICNDMGITQKTPLIKQILRKYEKFKWLFRKDSFTI